MRNPSNLPYNNFGSEVRHMRLSLGMTQKILSEKTAINQSVISQIETGSSHPSYEEYWSLTKALFDGRRLEWCFEPSKFRHVNGYGEDWGFQKVEGGYIWG